MKSIHISLHKIYNRAYSKLHYWKKCYNLLKRNVAILNRMDLINFSDIPKLYYEANKMPT